MNERIDSNLIGPAEVSLARSSNQIKDDVALLIALNDLVQPKSVDIDVQNGVVILTGRVRDMDACRAAVDAAKDVLGVIEVINRLEIGE